jgi:hypothetical protein
MRSEPFISDWVAGSGGGQQAARGTAARGGRRRCPAGKFAGARQNNATEHEMKWGIHQNEEGSTRISPSYSKRKERRRRRRSMARGGAPVAPFGRWRGEG